MGDLLALIVALLTLVAGTASDPIVVASDDPTPAGVDPVEQAAVITDDGTIYHLDGTVDCVTASPCAYAAAGYQPDDPIKPGDVDPIWFDIALTRGHDASLD